MKWNTGIRQPYTIGILSYTDSWYLVPLVLIYPATMCVCFGYHNQEQSDIWINIWRSFLQRGTEQGTQQENSATKLVDICRSSCNSNAWQSEWGFCLEMCWLNSRAKRFFRRKWVSRLAWKQTGEVSKITGWLETCYSWGAYVHNWVKWPERESDYKPWYNVEITSGAIILSIYMSILSI